MLEEVPVRSYEAVREAIDSKLGSGVGLLARDAAVKLEPVEHVVWALDNLLACLFEFRLHIWDQGFAGPDYDGPRVIAGIARAARASDPVIAELLLWTCRWVRTRGVPMVSVVPEVWARHAEAARRFLLDVAARWPETLDPVSLAPGTFERALSTESIGIGFTSRGASCAVQCAAADQHREGVFRAVVTALWQGGASDQTLDDFFSAYFDTGTEEVEVVCRFVSFDGDGGDAERKAALQAAIRPVSRLAKRLGVAEVPMPSVIRFSARSELDGLLDDWRVVHCEGPSLSDSVRSALRMDPDALTLDATLLLPGDDALLQSAVYTGHLLIAVGDSPVMEALLRSLQTVPFFDLRTTPPS